MLGTALAAATEARRTREENRRRKKKLRNAALAASRAMLGNSSTTCIIGNRNNNSNSSNSNSNNFGDYRLPLENVMSHRHDDLDVMSRLTDDFRTVMGGVVEAESSSYYNYNNNDHHDHFYNNNNHQFDVDEVILVPQQEEEEGEDDDNSSPDGTGRTTPDPSAPDDDGDDENNNNNTMRREGLKASRRASFNGSSYGADWTTNTTTLKRRSSFNSGRPASFQSAFGTISKNTTVMPATTTATSATTKFIPRSNNLLTFRRNFGGGVVRETTVQANRNAGEEETMAQVVKRLQRASSGSQVLTFTKDDVRAIAAGSKKILFTLAQLKNVTFSKEEFGKMMASEVLRLTFERPLLVEIVTEDAVEGEDFEIF